MVQVQTVFYQLKQLIKPETVDSAADLSAVNTDDIEMNITFTFPKEIYQLTVHYLQIRKQYHIRWH